MNNKNQSNWSGNRQRHGKKMKKKNKKMWWEERKEKRKWWQNPYLVVKSPEEEEQERADNKNPDTTESVGEGQSNTTASSQGIMARNDGSSKMRLTPLLAEETQGRSSSRHDCTLYVRFPSSLSVTHKSYIEPLVPSAVDIRLPRLNPGNYAKFCYIEFETEEEATKIKENLSNIKVKGEAYYADYVGKKSKVHTGNETKNIDPLRLYVGGLPNGVNMNILRSAFPTATQVLFKKPNHNVSISHAYLIFASHEKALGVFKASKGLKILGKEVIVMFAADKKKGSMFPTYEKNAYRFPTYGEIVSKNEEDESVTPPAKKQKTEDEKEGDE